MAEKKKSEEKSCVYYYVTHADIAPGPTPTPPLPQPPHLGPSHIDYLRDEYFMDLLITQVLDNPCLDEFLRKARNLLEILDSGPLVSESDACTISRAIDDVWQDPCFYEAVCAAMKEEIVIIHHVLSNSNDHLPFRRMTDMTSDHYFTTLMHSVTDGKIATTIRACMCIVLGHWIHDAHLPQLDKGLGRDCFGPYMARRAAKKKQTS